MATSFLGYMILKQIGVCALGSFMMDPKSMAESLQTVGANPPKNPKPLFKTPDALLLEDAVFVCQQATEAYRYPGDAEPRGLEESQAALLVAREVFDAILARVPKDARP